MTDEQTAPVTRRFSPTRCRASVPPFVVGQLEVEVVDRDGFAEARMRTPWTSWPTD